MAAPLIFDEAVISDLKSLRLALRRIRSGGIGGESLTSERGGQFEFAGHVPYTIGSDPRYIDWRLFARLGDLHLKHFHRESELEIIVLLDGSASMALPDTSPWMESRRIAAGLAFSLSGSGVTVRVCELTDAHESAFIDVRGEPECASLVNHLESLPRPSGHLDPRDLTPHLRSGSRPRLVLFISDFMMEEPPAEILAHGAGKGLQLGCICLSSRAAFSPKPGGLVSLQDAETGETVKLPLSQAVLKRYRNLFAARQKQLEVSARRAQAGWVEVRTPSHLSDMFRKIILSGVIPS